jgi:hypothetical protein
LIPQLVSLADWSGYVITFTPAATNGVNAFNLNNTLYAVLTATANTVTISPILPIAFKYIIVGNDATSPSTINSIVLNGITYTINRAAGVEKTIYTGLIQIAAHTR